MPTLSQVLAAIDRSINVFNHWQSRRYLITDFTAPGVGKARSLSKENAYELAFQSMLLDHNIDPDDASLWTAQWLDRLAKGEAPSAFVASKATKKYQFHTADELAVMTVGSWYKQWGWSLGTPGGGWVGGPMTNPKPAPLASIIFVPLDILMQRMDALFEE